MEFAISAGILIAALTMIFGFVLFSWQFWLITGFSCAIYFLGEADGATSRSSKRDKY